MAIHEVADLSLSPKVHRLLAQRDALVQGRAYHLYVPPVLIHCHSEAHIALIELLVSEIVVIVGVLEVLLLLWAMEQVLLFIVHEMVAHVFYQLLSSLDLADDLVYIRFHILELFIAQVLYINRLNVLLDHFGFEVVL